MNKESLQAAENLKRMIESGYSDDSVLNAAQQLASQLGGWAAYSIPPATSSAVHRGAGHYEGSRIMSALLQGCVPIVMIAVLLGVAATTAVMMSTFYWAVELFGADEWIARVGCLLMVLFCGTGMLAFGLMVFHAGRLFFRLLTGAETC